MTSGASPLGDSVRAAEVVAALSLATDLSIGVPIEYGLQSTLIAMRLADRLGVDRDTASSTYYACLLFYAGCTADAEMTGEIFANVAAMTSHGLPVRFGSRRELAVALSYALADPGTSAARRAVQAGRRFPRLARTVAGHRQAFCEVAQLLTDQLGVPAAVRSLFVHIEDRWDGKGFRPAATGDDIPLAIRIVHVARDAAFQRNLGGPDHAIEMIRLRAGKAFDPAIARLLADEADEILALHPEESTWAETLGAEPGPPLILEGEAIAGALAGMGHFADLVSPYLVGHSAGVADLAAAAARRSHLDTVDVTRIERAASIHDLGRVAVSSSLWQKAEALTPDDWEQVRLHAYQSERVLVHSPFLADLAPIATFHHERLDGSGYHRGTTTALLTPPARLLAAADAYHAMTEPRPHREVRTKRQAATMLAAEASAGRLDANAVGAVIEAAGQTAVPVGRPAGLTEREVEVVGLIARGLQTKQVAHALGISVKTADRHIQNAYGKIGVSTRAAAAMFAMQHGFVSWGELPMGRVADDT